MGGPSRARWRLLPQDPAHRDRLAPALGLSPIVAQILINRGLGDAAAARAFLDAGSAEPTPPSDLPGMSAAIDRLVRAIRDQTAVVVYGDYDADGVTATAILLRALRRAGGSVDCYLPDRQTEGYGLHAVAVEHLAARAGLLVAVDCGITAHAAAGAARAAGLDLIILDHHLPLGAVPDACAVVNPKIGGIRTDYCAAGLAWQAARGLLAALGLDPAAGDLLDLAALGTVADAVELLHDNRIIVARGLMQLQQSSNAGLRALIEVAGLRAPFGARDLSHGLAPRINAAGRLAHAGTAVRLLVSDDPTDVKRLAEDLDRLNARRRALCEQVLAEALEEIEAQALADSPAIVLAREGWHPGVVGIVASQVVDLYSRPAVLIAVREGVGKGSARSVPPLHLVDALARAAPALDGFGGHAMAAGLTVRADAIPQFRTAFLESVARALAPEDLEPVFEVDAELALAQVTRGLADELAHLAPFGPGNARPVFLSRGLRVSGTRMVGGGAHLRLVVSDGTHTADAIGFRLGDLAELLAFTQARVDLTYAVEVERWRDSESVQLVVEHLWTPEVDPAAVTTDTSLLLARLFDRAGEYLDARHREIDEAPAFHTKIVGVTFDGRQALLPEVRPGERLRLVRDPANPRDPHAIKVCLADGRPLGFLRATLAARLAPAIDAGARYTAAATALTGGGDRAWGVNILVEREPAWATVAGLEGEVAARPPSAAQFAGWVTSRLGRRGPLPEIHRRIVETARAGHRVAARQAPGRGLLSVVASLSAALVTEGSRPVAVVLPRACEADACSRILGAWLRDIGVRTRSAHGVLSLRARSRVEGAFARGEVDLLVGSMSWMLSTGPGVRAVIVIVDDLTPEEDLLLLAGRYGDRIRLVAGPSSGDRMRRAAAVCAAEYLDVPSTPRTNLRMIDHRAAAGWGHAEFQHLRAEKVLVLASGAAAGVEIGRGLRQEMPNAADRIAYYHDGIPAALRRAIEDLYGAGAIQILVAGSLLVPPGAPLDITNAVALGLLPTRLLAAEALGVAGAGGGTASIVLRYGPEALEATAEALDRRHPRRDTLVQCYHYFSERGRGGSWVWPATDGPVIATGGMPFETLSAALEIFVESGVITAEGGDADSVRYTVTESAGRSDLDRSLRYREGVRERAAWADLRAWAGGPAAVILADLARD